MPAKVKLRNMTNRTREFHIPGAKDPRDSVLRMEPRGVCEIDEYLTNLPALQRDLRGGTLGYVRSEREVRAAENTAKKRRDAFNKRAKRNREVAKKELERRERDALEAEKAAKEKAKEAERARKKAKKRKGAQVRRRPVPAGGAVARSPRRTATESPPAVPPEGRAAEERRPVEPDGSSGSSDN